MRDSYIVVLKPEAGPAAAAAPALANQHGLSVAHTYTHALQGMAVRASEAQIAAVAQDARVAYVERDAVFEANDEQLGATWGLDRVDQRNLPLDTIYRYEGYGTDVHAYVIDTGLYAEHTEFTGRVQPGWDAVDNDDTPQDCHGHGTHVAGTVLGTTYGVAKQAWVHGVRVLSCTGSGTTAGVIAGIDWVTANHIKPAVANMSLGGGFSQALNDAVTNSVAAGVTYAVAAGNESSDACGRSPASTPTAFTIAASDSADARASFSNFGTCVDIFAPGVSVTSAGITNPTSTATMSGTSMASPHAAGVAALYLGANPDATPAEVMTGILEEATVDIITNPGTGSPNRLAYMGDFPGENFSRGRLKVTSVASCAGPIAVRVTDADLIGAGTQNVAVSTTEGDQETITLAEDAAHPGRFDGTLSLGQGSAAPGDGTVQVAHGTTVTVTYEDADNGEGVPATVSATSDLDCAGPALSGVLANPVWGSGARLSATASEPATLWASYGLSCAVLDGTSPAGSLALTPATTLSNLTKNTTYFFALHAADKYGNQSSDDNAGACYSFTTPSTIYTEDFEDGLGTITSVTGLWHASQLCASTLAGHSQPGTLYYGQDSTCNFNVGTTSGVARSVPVSVQFDLGPVLHFGYFLGTEGDQPTFDRASVEVAVNGGTPIVVASTFGIGQKLLVNTGAWQATTLPLAALGTGSGSVELYFRFNSVDSIGNTYAGFYVDDVEIQQLTVACDNDEDCIDANYCNGVESCVDQVCTAGTSPCPNDGVACTVEQCDEGSDACSSVPSDALCDNGAFCDGAELCTTTGCVPGTAPCTPDAVACTVEGCNEASNACTSTPDHALCDNGAFCDGAELCTSTGCAAGTSPCTPDSVACTVDSCNEAENVCESISDDTLCDNGLFCDGAEQCDGAGCVGGPAACVEGQVCQEETNVCCEPESAAAFCARLGANCGSVSGLDNCGVPRTVESCGACTAPDTCGGSGVPNVCGGDNIDRTEGGTASGTGTACSATEAVAKAYDNQMTSGNFSRWCVTAAPTTSAAIATSYDFAGSTSFVVKRYTITTANDSPTRDPKNWTLQGCQGTCNNNSNTGWVTLDTRTNQFAGAARYQTNSYTVANTTAYQQYRLRFTANNGATNRFQVAEIQMFGPVGCLAETNAAFCSRLGKNCGSVTATDNCGASRTVSSCGTCTSPETCGGGGSANVCGSGSGPCSSPPWTASTSYSSGALVTADCQVSTTGTVCYNNVGALYAWRCDFPTYCNLRPGSNQSGWWSAWTQVQRCN